MALRRHWIGFVLFGAAFAVYLATTVHLMVNTDVWSANFLSWRISTTGSPWIEGLRIPRLDHDPNRSVWVMQAANGHTVITRAPGVVAVSLPAYFLLHPDHMTLFPGSLTAALMTAGSVVLMYGALAASQRRFAALLGAVAYGFATPVWSISANGVWPHTVTGFGIAGMAWASAHRRWWWAGVFGGIALWGRPHAAIIAALLGLLLGWWRREPRITVRIGVASGLFLGAMCVWTHWIYGTWNPTGSYDGTTLQAHAASSWLDPVNQLGMWIAPDRGILVWTPVVALLLPALVRSWRELPDWSRALVWGGLLYTFVQAELNPFGGGFMFYGYRYGLAFLGCAAPALALSVPRAGRVARHLLGPVVAVQLFAFALGAVFDRLWLPADQIWHNNAFVNGLNLVGWPAWFLAALLAALGYAVGRALMARSAHRSEGRATESAHGGDDVVLAPPQPALPA